MRDDLSKVKNNIFRPADTRALARASGTGMAHLRVPSCAMALRIALIGAVVLYLVWMSRWHVEIRPQFTGVPVREPPMHDLVLLVFPTSVDNDRHGERVAAILDTWGRESFFKEMSGPKAGRKWRISVRFVSKHGKMNAGALPPGLKMPAHAKVYTPTELGPTAQFAWALQRIVDEQTRERGRSLDTLWVAKLDTITYVLLESLLGYIASLDAADSHFLGRRLRIDDEFIFLSGGAGFVASGGAVGRYLAAWPKCLSERVAKNDWLRDARDVGVTTCFTAAGMRPNVTVDSRQRQRFHMYGVKRTVGGKFDKWATDYSNNIGEPVRGGADCCAPDSVTFHYVEGPEARVVDAILHGQAAWSAMTPADRLARWPKNVGGYSEPPELGDVDVWKLLLSGLRPPLVRFEPVGPSRRGGFR